MNTFLEMQTELQSRLSITGSSSFYTLARIKSELNDIHIWAGSLFDWPALKDARRTSSIAGNYYYDYPSTFRPESIWTIEIDGKEYNPKDFDDFMDYKRNNPSDTSKRIFANYGLQYFVFPTPTANGTNNIDVWGFKNAPALSADGDKTIFSDYDPAGNEAIVKQALAVLQAKGKDKKTGQIEDAEAKAILAGIYQKILQNRQRYQKLDHPRFDVPDYFGSSLAKYKIGNF